MSTERTPNETTSDIFKASLVGILAVVIAIISPEKFIVQLLGIPFEEFRGGLPAPYLILLFLIYFAMAMVLARMKTNLDVSKRGAFFIVFAFHYVIVSFLPELEGKVYLPDFPFLQTFIGGLFQAVAVVSLIFYLWKGEGNPEANVGQQISAYFSSRPVMSWIWRFFVVWLLFYVLGMLFSIMAYPFNKPFLDDMLNTIGMEVPSVGAQFAIFQLRSFFYILVTLPFIIFWKSSKRNLFLYLALINVIQYPVLGDGLAYWWPVMYRLIDGIVLTLQVTSISWLYANLLWKGEQVSSG